MPHPIQAPRPKDLDRLPSLAVLYLLECTLAATDTAIRADFPELEFDDLAANELSEPARDAHRLRRRLRELEHDVEDFRYTARVVDRRD